jgi:serine-type D-Ala-D-Ala carboxypeptidase (penicillin-binding protein 5/6)
MRIRAGVAIALTCSLGWASLVWWRLAQRDQVEVTAQATKTLSRITVPWPLIGQAALEVEGMGSLGSSGVDGAVPIASLAKVMTAYLVLEHDPIRDGDRGFTVTMGDNEVTDFQQRQATDQSVVSVRNGEVMDERQLLEALLLPSANNIAVALAVYEAGSVDAFVDRMNDAASDLGMDHTTYTDPSGLDEDTVSTAPDQLRVVRAALRDRTFADIVQLPSTSLPVVGEVENTNPLLRDPGFVGVKTGSDDAAGGCLAFATVRSVRGHDVKVVGVVLGQRGRGLIGAAGEATRPLVEAVYSSLAERPAA